MSSKWDQYLVQEETNSNPDYGYGLRSDKTNKGKGYFGEMPMKEKDGVFTEVGASGNINGKEIDYPLVVPTLNKEELDFLASGAWQHGTPIPESIQEKGRKHAEMRIAQGKSPFATVEEEGKAPLPGSSKWDQYKVSEESNQNEEERKLQLPEGYKSFFDMGKTLALQGQRLLESNELGEDVGIIGKGGLSGILGLPGGLEDVSKSEMRLVKKGWEKVFGEGSGEFLTPESNILPTPSEVYKFLGGKVPTNKIQEYALAFSQGGPIGVGFQALKNAGWSDTALEGLSLLFMSKRLSGPGRVKTSPKKIYSKAPTSGLPPEPPPPGGDFGKPDMFTAMFQKEAPQALPFIENPIARQKEAVSAMEPSKGKALGIKVKIEPKEAAEGVKERTVTTEEPLGNIITREKFESDAEGGNKIATEIKNKAEEEKEPHIQAYKESDKILEGEVGIHKALANRIEKEIEKLEKLAYRNPGQETVLKILRGVGDLVGGLKKYGGFREANAKLLLDQAKAISAVTDYEMPYQGYKALLKKLVRDIHTSVFGSLRKNREAYNKVRLPDKLFAKWAKKYLNENLQDFLKYDIENPEQLFNKATKDPVTYRAIKKIIGESNPELLKKLDRAVVESRLKKYNDDPNLVGTEDFHADINNLKEIIGEKETSKVLNLLKLKKVQHRRNEMFQRKLKEGAEKYGKAKKESTGKPFYSPILKKISERTHKTPEDIDKAFSSVTQLENLKSELAQKGQEKLFEELVKDKFIRIFNKDRLVRQKPTGAEIMKTIDENAQVLESMIGREALKELYIEAYKANRSSLNVKTIAKIANLAIHTATPLLPAGILFKILSKVLQTTTH